MRSSPPSGNSSDALDPIVATPSEDLEDLYEHAPCGYLSLQPDGRIFKVNATFASWTGYSKAELVGKHLIDLLHMASRIFYETHFAPLLRMQGFFNEVALDFQPKGGERLPVLANAIERRNASGRLLFTRLTIFQAGERRRYERELRDAKAAAEAARSEVQALNADLEKRIDQAVAERMRAEESLLAEKHFGELREQFIAILGHDLRNPLASIDAGVNLILRRNRSHEIEKVATLIQGSVRRMSGLIDNVLDFARARLGGGISLNRVANRELEPVLRQVIAELRAGFPDRSIETELCIVQAVDCDSARIGQLASNLIANALTHGAADTPVRIEAATTGGFFELSVSNHGDPIPDEVLDRLFLPFARGDDRSPQGLGLGLYIASEIAKAHGGVLTATSTEEATRFAFRMRVA
jgi:sigma-B regulation protein RsbU (phosphoserine phosphatase)